MADKYQTIDVVVRLPTDDYAEVASASRYAHVPGRFRITASGTNPALWSGCVGVGLNRLLMCLWIAHGLDETKWPAGVAVRPPDRKSAAGRASRKSSA